VWANVKLAALPEVLLLASKAMTPVGDSRRHRSPSFEDWTSEGNVPPQFAPVVIVWTPG